MISWGLKIKLRLVKRLVFPLIILTYNNELGLIIEFNRNSRKFHCYLEKNSHRKTPNQISPIVFSSSHIDFQKTQKVEIKEENVNLRN